MLITLGVIGIVAAMTIPTLVVQHKRHVIETRMQQAAAIFNNALANAIADNGATELWAVNGVDSFVQNYLLKYLNVADTCTRVATSFDNTGNIPRKCFVVAKAPDDSILAFYKVKKNIF